jgi:hypothetical protein
MHVTAGSNIAHGIKEIHLDGERQFECTEIEDGAGGKKQFVRRYKRDTNGSLQLNEAGEIITELVYGKVEIVWHETV